MASVIATVVDGVAMALVVGITAVALAAVAD
jgi:hypothetical protein